MPSLLRKNKEIIAIYDRHVSTVYRVCFSFVKNAADAEDLTQETFLRLMSDGTEFENERHEKAWLIVTASNLCRDTLRRQRRESDAVQEMEGILPEPDAGIYSVRDAILSLPTEYKTAVYMYYYEGYTTVEIARHLHCPETTVRSRLSRARDRLRTKLGGGSR